MSHNAFPNLNRRWLLAGVALIAASGLGFVAAKLTSAKTPVPAEAPETAATSAPGILEMDAARLQASGVQVQPVAVGGLASEVVAQGTVEAEPTGMAVLTARAAGTVVRLTKRLGDPVRAGETLALVESREAAQIAADRSVAASKAALARKVLARERRLYEQKVSPRQDYEAAQAELAVAEAELRRASTAAGAARVSSDGRYVAVTSPITGRITAMPVTLGAYVQPETELFRIGDPAKIQIEAAVTATDAERIQPGDLALVEVSSGATVSAVVRSVTPGVSEETRSATVVLTLTGQADLLQPGQLVRTRITARRSATSSIVVPEEAVQTIDGYDAVFVRTTKGFRVQRVTLGQRAGGRVSVAEGLLPGQLVAVKNAFLLKAELGKGGEEE
jgi:cobalt-zinc-cadmium efflux system membrane fusion protein